MHVDLLEEEVTGPLYKNILTSRPYRWWWPTDPFPFSVTKINHVLSLFTTVVWLSLWVRMFVTLLVGDVGKCVMTVTLTLITIATIVFLCLAQTKTPGPSEAWRAVRTYPKEGA
jgi:hypothetical protein